MSEPEKDDPGQLRLTVTRTADGIPIRKKVRLSSSGIIETIADYPEGLTWWIREIHEVSLDIDALAAFINGLSQRSDCCLVTGRPCGEIPLNSRARRIKNVHASGDLPTLEECASPWLPLDFDDIPIQGRLDPIDPEPAIAEVMAMMGEPFASSSYVWQLSAKATPGADRVRVRVFMLLDRHIDNDLKRRLAKGINQQIEIKLVDPALYTANQPIYTAAPEFIGADPFPRRCGVVYGEHEMVPWDEVHIPSEEAPRCEGSVRQGPVHASIAEYLSAIGDGPTGEGCHDAINRAVFSMVAHKWTPDRIKDTIRQTVSDALWDTVKHPSHTPAYLRVETSDWKLKSSIRGAEKLIKATSNPPRSTQTRPILDTVALPIAQIQAKEAISRWVRGEGPAKVVLAVTVGTGKTFQTAEAIKQELPKDRNLLFAFPTHNQGDEVAERLASETFGSDIAIKIQSRTRETETSAPLCQRPHLIKEIESSGVAGFTARIACKNDTGECPHYRGCSYYNQFRGEHRVRLIAHSTLETAKARAINDGFMNSCAGLVIDESPIDILLSKKAYQLADIQEAGGVIADIVEMARTGVDPESVDDLEGLISRLDEERKLKCQVDPPIHSPRAEDEYGLIQELRHLSGLKKPSLVPLYMGAKAWLMGKKNLVWFGKEKIKDSIVDSVIVAWRADISRFERVLVLDATPNEDAYRELLGDGVDFIRIDVQQNLEIIQAHDVPLGKSKIADPKKDGILARACALARAEKAGFISNKAAVELALERGYLPKDWPVGWFNALRGLNSMENLDALVILGRPEPDAVAIEARARALYPQEDLVFGGRYVWRTDGISSVASHPDSRCDGLLRTFREGEVEQALGRLRGVRASKPKRVFVLTHTPISQPGIKQMPLEQILMPEGLARLLIKGDGVAPLVPRIMAQMLPELWATEKAAKRWGEHNLKAPNALSNSLHKGYGAFKFRVRSQKRGSLALSWLDQFDTRSKLEALMSAEVVECSHTSAKGDPPPEPIPETAPKAEPSMRWGKPVFLVIPFASCTQYVQEQIETAFQPWMVPPLIEAQPIGVTT